MKIDASERLKNKSVLITGASKGVGRAIAIYLAKYKMKLGLLARSEDLLTKLAKEVESKGSQALALPLDLRKRGDVEGAVSNFKEKFGSPDFLINNAGIGWRNKWEDISLESELDMVALNCIAPIILIRLILPDMLKRNSGHIININSISGMYASPYMGGYCASKAAQLAYVTSLAHELEKTNVRISSVFSSAIDTDFHKNYKGFQKKGKILSPEFVAEKVLSLMLHPKERLCIGSAFEFLMVKIANLNPIFFRRIIESRKLPPV